MAGRLTVTQSIRRDRIETCQAELVGLLAMVDELMIRTTQAMRRTHAADDCLQPAIARLQQVRGSLRLVRQELADYWSERQTARWAGRE